MHEVRSQLMLADALNETTAVILAGGFGTRLQSVVSDRPKVLAAVAGRPFLAFLLDQLTACGIRRAVLCTGYMSDLVQREFGDSHGPLDIFYSTESRPLGTGGALRLAHPLLEGTSVLVLNGDSYCDVDLDSFWIWHRTHNATASLLLTRVPDVSRFGQVEVADSGRISRFSEKGSARGPGWINAGLYLLDTSLIEEIAPGQNISLEHEVFPRLIGAALLYGCPLGGEFIDIGTPESFARADSFFSARRSR